MEMKYELGLYEHNAKAYELSKKMLEEENMACIIHATGTGKSYVALQLIYDYIKENNNKRIVFLTPLNGIKDQIKEHIKNSNVPSNFFDNVEFLSYSALLNMTKEEFNNIGFCVCDEFHHVKAPKWKKQIDAMLEQNEDIKVFGMSATSIRGFGTSKEEDVSETFFKGNVASTYTLADAIVDGVLPAPEYHTNLLYLIDSEFPEIEEKLKYGTWSNEEKNAYLSDLNRMRQQLASSDEAKDMIKRHVKKDGKYLYFAKKGTNIEELQQEFLSSLPEEYRDNVEFYQVHSTNYAKSANKFSADCFYNNISEQGGKYEIIDDQKVVVGQKNETKLRVMFAIDMYNEGIHVPDLDGVIMGRNTKSDILFYQQLGRALSVKPKSNTSPLILDTVGNIKEIIRLYSTVRQKHTGMGGNPFVVSTTDREHYFRNVFGISQEVVDIVEEFERLKEIVNTRTELIPRIEYIYERYKDKGLPSKGSSDEFPFGSNAKIGYFLNAAKLKIQEQAQLGNTKAEWIINQLQLKARATDEEKEEQLKARIEYIYDTYKDKGLPSQRSSDEFSFGSNAKIGKFLEKNRVKIQEQATLGNLKAEWIINQLLAKVKPTDEEKEEEIKARIEYVYDTYKDKGLPTYHTQDRFSFGSSALIGRFLSNYKPKIQEQATLGNLKAEWIINQLQAKALPTYEEPEEEIKKRIEYIYDTYKDKGLPSQHSLDRFPFGSNALIGNFLLLNRVKIQEQATLGNLKAEWIINQLQAKAKPTEEEKEEKIKKRIEYIYDTYKDKGLPRKRSSDRFPFGSNARIGIFITSEKTEIIEQANLGNPKAMWICQQRKWIKIEEAKQEFDQNSNFGELKEILSGKNIDEGKSLS